MTSEVKIKILNVDDYAVGRETTTHILAQAGFAVVAAANGNEALQLAVECQPHLVLLDVRLPDLDGYEVCRQLKANAATAAIPVLLISGVFGEGEDKARGLESGADGYLFKPVQAVELIATINALVRMRQAETALRSSQEELLDFFENAPIALHWVGPDGKIIKANRAELELLGYSAEEYIGHHIAEFHAEQPVIGNLLQRLQKGETLCNYAASLRAKDGSIRNVLISSNVLWKDGQFIHTRCFTKDITALKQAETEKALLYEAEQQARRAAETANRMKDEFLATVSHELRAPLNSILGWVQLVREGKLSGQEATRALEIVERSARAQNHIIGDLLDVSQIIAGKMRLNVQPLYPAWVIEEALETVRPAAAAKSIHLEMVLDHQAGPMAGDAERLQQIIWNLLSNAIKFTPQAGRVQVRLARVESNIEITISDTGAGINPNFLPFAFDRFRQADSSSTRQQGGLGLGLAIVRHLVEMHGGTVRAETHGAGQGTSLIVSLPLLIVESQLDNAEVTRVNSPRVSQGSFGSAPIGLQGRLAESRAAY